MANIQNIKILFNNVGAFLNGALTNVDLSYLSSGVELNKKLSTKYILITGSTYQLFDYPAPGTLLVTLITNPLTNETWISPLMPFEIFNLFNAEICSCVGKVELLFSTTLSAFAGTTLIDPSFIGKKIKLIAFNGLIYSTGFILSGSTIAFTDGTSFAGGENVVVLYS